MIHTGRSGSTLLGNMLDQHQSVFWDGEIIEKMLHRMSNRYRRGINHLYGKVTPLEGLKEIQSRMTRLSGGRHVGVEIQDYHIQMMGANCEQFLIGVKRLGFDKFIILKRNPIRKLVSHIAATQWGQHHAKQDQASRRPKITINCDRVYVGHTFCTVEAALDQDERFFAAFEEHLENDLVLNIQYERDIENDPLVAIKKIFSFLELSQMKPLIDLRKTTPRDLTDVVENYEEFQRRLMSGRFRRHMEEILA